jgi:hypothetical protein
LSLANNNLLPNSSAVSVSLPHFQSFCSASWLPFSADKCHALFPYFLRIIKTYYLTFLLLVSLYPTPTVSVIPIICPDMMHNARRFGRHCLCLTTNYFLSPSLSVCFYPTPTVSVIPLLCPYMMPSARRCVPHCLWLITFHF